MGPTDDYVLDSRLRVRGVTGLRVVDVSILPEMTAGNLNAPIMAMAWHAADLIAEDNAANQGLSSSALARRAPRPR
jgi:choline dehydrogenase-like flavoprotein